ncbi:unnamed protein product [Didymodactylos carnosus]|uniref:Uncharacterized protein n=1 Tax=Didymodactylos carnosus TaxID=1234261 RepID=A0A814BBL3_9BILA|nr:unnamed protein product [Didymodactylos carnosus]CAF0925660.1 unnamed protein product [Didymodactylos carnosus]CAF3662286.1 unnamed protein product [Didymodactylos carnosus]CAF3704319.1 unnamed protein product [Didymodactylos carnosus]
MFRLGDFEFLIVLGLNGQQKGHYPSVSNGNTTKVHKQSLVKHYIIKKDFISGLKYREFSVYDPTEQQLLYRIDTTFHILHRVKITNQPEKKLLATVNGKFRFFLYGATFKILTPGTQQWKEGKIERSFTLSYKFIITYDNRQVIFEGDRNKWHMSWTDAKTHELLASFEKRMISLVWQNTYDLKIYTDELPDIFFFVGLAVADRSTSNKDSKG